MAFYVFAGGDWMFGYRLYHPAIVLSALLLSLVLTRLANETHARYREVSTTALVILCSINLVASLLDSRVQAGTHITYVHRGVEVGKWMRANLPREALLATNTAGAVPYYSNLPVLDMMGLTDRVIARRRDIPSDWKGIEKGDGAYVLSRRPDYILFGSSRGSEEPIFLSDVELFINPEFWRRYRRITLDVPNAGRLILYARREEPGPEPSPEDWARISEVAARRVRESAFRY